MNGTEAVLTADEAGNAGGGNSTLETGSSIAQALGFVTEFNENVRIFNEILLPVLIMHDLSIFTHASHIVSLEDEMVSVWHRIAQLAGNTGAGGDSTNRPSSADTFTK